MCARIIGILCHSNEIDLYGARSSKIHKMALGKLKSTSNKKHHHFEISTFKDK